jgi:branched-subunit amino acid ABC-type transport system permease component
MKSYLPYLIIGITTGSVYGIAALGLVLTYKTSGLLNFGHGAIAAAAAVVFYTLHVRQGLAWPLAALVAIVPFGIVAGLLMERLAAVLASAPVANRIVATVGLVVAVPALVGLIYGDQGRVFPPFLPRGVAFNIAGVRVGWDSVSISVLGVATAAGLFIFFRRSRLGVSMRAVVDRPVLVDLTGQSPTRIRRIAWVIGCTFAAVSGVLLANTLSQLAVLLLALLVVQAFGAATVGAFTSLPLAYIGGVVLGVVQALIGKLAATHTILQGVDLNVPFLFLFVGLLVIPKHRLVELGERIRPRVRSIGGGSISRRLPLYTALSVAVVLVPFVVGTHLPVWNSALAQLLLFLSLGLLVRTSGQISLCQVGLAAIGATTFAHMLGSGVPWALAVLIGGLVAVPVGAVIAIPAIRLSGLYLALATLGFGILLAQYFYTKSYMFGTSTALKTARPHMFNLQSDRGYYFLLLACGLLGMGFVTMIERARLGRLLRGMSDSPTALSTLGTNTNVTRVLVFCASAFLAGVSGALVAGLFPSISSAPFPYLQSLIVLAVLMISGRRTIPSAIIATFLLTIPAGYIHGSRVGDIEQMVFGLAAVVAGLVSQGRLTEFFGRYAARHEGRVRGPAGARSTPSLQPTVRAEAAV